MLSSVDLSFRVAHVSIQSATLSGHLFFEGGGGPPMKKERIFLMIYSGIPGWYIYEYRLLFIAISFYLQAIMRAIVTPTLRQLRPANGRIYIVLLDVICGRRPVVLSSCFRMKVRGRCTRSQRLIHTYRNFFPLYFTSFFCCCWRNLIVLFMCTFCCHLIWALHYLWHCL